MWRWLILSSTLSLSIGIFLGGMLALASSPSPVAPTTTPIMPSTVAVPTSIVPVPTAGHLETVRVSYYQPWRGGPNCSHFVGGECVSRMASGKPWQDYIGRAAACPPEWRFGTLIILPGGEQFECLDRGSRIRYDNGYAWIDLLVTEAPVAFGTLLEVRIIP